jgi:hypothetical protein
LLYGCDDDPMSFYMWYRDGYFLGITQTHSSEFVDMPPPGVHEYQVQAIDGENESWLSRPITVQVD